MCGAVLGTAAVAPIGALASAPQFWMKDVSLEELSYSALAAQLNTVFHVQAGPARQVPLELVDAPQTPERPAGAGATRAVSPPYEQFSLIFRGAVAEPLEQRIFKFEHADLGRFELFIVPVVSRDLGHAYYEAVFNRPKPSPTSWIRAAYAPCNLPATATPNPTTNETMSTPFIGEIVMFAGNFAPRGWAFCNGQLLAISQNTALFSILGTTYGGNGQTNFALPNLQSRVPIHPGQGPGLSPYVLGQTGGVETVTLLSNNLPAHNHLVNCAGSGGTQTGPAGGVPAVESTGTSANFAAAGDGSTMNSAMIGIAGGNQPFAIVQPYQCVNFIIALQGIFPSRNW
jgi:microcystin-dependent protein